MKKNLLNIISNIQTSPCRVNLHDLKQRAEKALQFIQGHPALFAPTWSDLFKLTPIGKDFDWSAEEAGDWVPSEDGDGHWYKEAYALDLSRENRVERVSFTSVDFSGNWDCTASFEQRTGRRLQGSELLEFQQECAEQHCYYTLLKQSLYGIHVAQTGEDPLENTLGQADPREVHLRDLAYEVLDLVASVYETAALNR